MTEHLSWELLNDFVDGRLDPPAAADAREHLSLCQGCSATLTELRDFLSESAALSASLNPPPEILASIRETISQNKSVPLHSAAWTVRARWWHSPRHLAAAAVLLVAATSAATALLVTRNGGETVYVNTPQTLAMLPIAWENAEQGYLASVDELSEALADLRPSLSPSTIETVERSLTVIDSAIVEARSALVRDPANAALADLLASNYRQKVELLRRATELDPRT